MASIHAPAVIITNNTGVITVINLTITKGDGSVVIRGPASVGNSTLNSSKQAVAYASKYLNFNESKYNFTYVINDHNTSVSGPSAGMAMTLLAISAMTHKPLIKNFTLTGEIEPNGSIGEIGGVYDKVDAASRDHLKFVLVPYAPNSSFENELYYLGELNFNIPLVPVKNITDAVGYAIDNKPIVGNYIHYNFYTNYDLKDLPNASLKCIGNCNSPYFEGLANFTFKITGSLINEVKGDPRLSNASSQFYEVLNESEAISNKGYYYTGSDISFLDYANLFVFANRNDSISEGYDKVLSVDNYCNSLTKPNLTNLNYQYVIGGELRQLWGNYTISKVLKTYNNTSVDSDGVMRNLYEAGLANAWCEASSYMYKSADEIGGKPYKAENLSLVASKILDEDEGFPDNMYETTALRAYTNHNYPLAIYDGIYGYVLENDSGLQFNTSQLLNKSIELDKNSTYGIWATQFADESMFYVYQSESMVNKSEANLYAFEAYQTANLASNMSYYTLEINSSLKPVTAVKEIAVNTEFNYIFSVLTVILILVVVLILMQLFFYYKLLNLIKGSKVNKNKVTFKRTRRSKRSKK